MHYITRLTKMFQDHVNRVIADSGGLAEFTVYYLNEGILPQLATQVSSKMQQSLIDREVHSVQIIKSSICYFIWTCPFGLPEAASWFELRYGGYIITL